MDKVFSIKIVTPKKVVEESGIKEMRVITDKGEVTILPNHVEYLANIEISILKIFIDDIEKDFAVGGGVIHFDESENKAILILNSVYTSKDVNIEKLKEEENKIKSELESASSTIEHKVAERNLRQIINQLSLIKK